MKPLRIFRYSCASLLLFALSAHAADTAKRVVLPDAVAPIAYRIDFTPDIDGLTFKGTAEIDLNVRRATQTIVLNAADMVIDSVSLSGESQAPTISYDAKVQTATFTFGKPLAAGNRTLKLAYHGTIYQNATGLFALDYQNPNGAKKGPQRALFTQFENSDARRFVPCWDEPGIKATFELTATLPAGLMPVSNMPVAATDTVAGDKQRVRFAKSPRMSTYLLFFGVGDFERVHRMVEGVDVGIVVKRGDTANAAFALDAAADLLPYFNDYFGTPYPLPKLDMIAGPGSSQFFGAMENWGAIFYFERYLLVDSRLSTQGNQQFIYSVIAHEIAHMWFGDLVTMAWWDDLWLNEGFATWMADKATNHFHPEWNVWLGSLGEKQAVMQRDARDGTHPIITPIEDVFQAANAFDDITYGKGSAVLRALEFHTGDAAFRAGVRSYMQKYKYGNTVTDDLWAEIGKASKTPITQIAHDLTLQAGVPMVNMLSSKCAGGKTTVSLSQTHFAIDASSTSARVWHVPVKVATLGGAPTTVIVSGTKPTPVEVEGCGPVILNAGQGGYMRSLYSKEGFAAIAANYAKLSADDQLGVLNDTISLGYTGEQPMSDYFELTRNFPAGADPVLVSTLAQQLSGIDLLYDGLPSQAAFRSYARRVLKPAFARVGWDARPGESANTIRLRSSLISALNTLGDAEVIAETRARFEKYLASPRDFGPDARRSLLANVAVQADEKVWDRLHAMAKASTSELERQELYELLGSAQDEALAQRALALVFSGEIPPTFAPDIVGSVAGRHTQLALDFAIGNWDKLSKMIEASSAFNYMPTLATNSADLVTIDKLDKFAAAHVPENARQDYVVANARIRYLARIRDTRLPEADRWVAAQNR
jgi:aminopeptidase N